LALRSRIEHEKIVLPDQFYYRTEFFTQQLLTWNKIHNMTGATTKEEIEDHLFDAIYPMSFLPAVKNCLDIGTGAGFPGIIMAMAMENTHFTLVEPLRKRSSFLTFIASSLRMENVSVIGKKVEDIPVEAFELITSRAVTATDDLLKLSQPFTQKGTQLLYFKGERVYDEVDESYDYKIIEAPHRNYLLIQR
jgi:16S rRNA (guanine527-N7)-methyltransferase